MGFGKPLVDDNLFGSSRLRNAAHSHIELIERGLADVGQGNDLPGGWLQVIRNVEQCELGDPHVHCRNAGDLHNLIDKGLRCASDFGKDIGKAMPFVVGGPRFIQGSIGPDS